MSVTLFRKKCHICGAVYLDSRPMDGMRCTEWCPGTLEEMASISSDEVYRMEADAARGGS